MRQPSNGWIKIWRAIQHHHIVRQMPHAYLTVWLLLLVNARREPGSYYIRGKQIALPAGSLLIGTVEFSRLCKVPPTTLRRVFTYLCNCAMITTKADTKGTAITICNWDTYQNDEEASGEQTENERTANGERADPYGEGKKGRKKKNPPYPPAVARVAREILARHPEQRRDIGLGTVATKLAAIIREKNGDGEQELERINRNHAAWCSSSDWTKEDGQYAKGLGNWLAPTMGRFDAAPAPASSQGRLPAI